MRPMGFRDPAVKHVLKNKRPNGTREVRLIIAPSINGGDQLADGNSSLDCNQASMSPSTAPQDAGSYPFRQYGDEADLSRVPKPIAQLLWHGSGQCK